MLIRLYYAVGFRAITIALSEPWHDIIIKLLSDMAFPARTYYRLRFHQFF